MKGGKDFIPPLRTYILNFNAARPRGARVDFPGVFLPNFPLVSDSTYISLGFPLCTVRAGDLPDPVWVVWSSFNLVSCRPLACL